MPTYHYQCSNEDCQHDFEKYQSFTDNKLTKCPKCKKKTIDLVLYPFNIMSSDPKTIGALAEKNTNSLGNYGKEAFFAQQKAEEKIVKEQGRAELQKRLPKGASLPPISNTTPFWKDS